MDELERALYGAPFIAIQPNNRGAPVEDLDALRAAVASGRAASAGAGLRRGVIGVDVDAPSAALGDAAARELLERALALGQPYLLRKSGRPGGRHFFTPVNSPAEAAAWRQLCADTAERLGIVVDDRTGGVLRLLSAPHRRGLPSEIVANTLTPEAVNAAAASYREAPCEQKVPLPKRTSRRSEAEDSRSEKEFGTACALAREDCSAVEAWNVVATKGSKARDRGQQWWRRYVWLPAVTISAAESGLTEVKAWSRAKAACPEIARDLHCWRGLWRRANAETQTLRPRRRHRNPTPKTPTESPEVTELEAGLLAAVQGIPDLDPRRRRSLAAVLCALAPALVLREGSISLRDLSVRAQVSLSTVRSALTTLFDCRLLAISRTYAGGADDCTAYRIGPAATSYITEAQHYQHTSSYTPRPLGRCSPAKLRAQYARDRAYWKARCDALAALAPGERLANSQHPAAKLMRSLWFQRRWWTTLPAREQDIRRAARREMLQRLHRSERRAWFRWLSRRHDIIAAVDRTLTHTETPEDAETVLNAPLTIYRGMRDPQWRTAGVWRPSRPPSTAEQLELCAA